MTPAPHICRNVAVLATAYVLFASLAAISGSRPTCSLGPLVAQTSTATASTTSTSQATNTRRTHGRTVGAETAVRTSTRSRATTIAAATVTGCRNRDGTLSDL